MGREEGTLMHEPHYRERMPRWLLRPIRSGRNLCEVTRILRSRGLNTVCESARCPNRMECFSSRTATFMILGDICTRDCTFCGVEKGCPLPVDKEEPVRLAEAAAEMGLEHVVITSVTRDDLADGGAGQFAAALREVRKRLPASTLEVLTPDFQGSEVSLRTVLEEAPDVFNHNLETVEELYPKVRPMADYRRSLRLLAMAKEQRPAMKVKSGIMVGLGEKRDQLRKTFRHLAEAGCDMLTIGQYLRPSRKQLPVERFVPPEEFEELREEAMEAGIPLVFSAPLVRSSYKAKEAFERAF